jgi:hypothetical protein
MSTPTTHYGPSPHGAGDTLHVGTQSACTAPDCAARGAEHAAETLRVLSVRQPYAFAIAEGFKPIENRTRRTHYRGEIFLHAPKTLEKGVSIVRYSRDAARRLDELGGQLNFWDAIAACPSRFYTPPTTLALSAVIGTARITGCHQAGDGCGPACTVWGQPDAWHWELADARPLTAAVPKKGALGLWKPTPGLVQSVHARRPATTADARNGEH